MTIVDNVVLESKLSKITANADTEKLLDGNPCGNNELPNDVKLNERNVMATPLAVRKPNWYIRGGD